MERRRTLLCTVPVAAVIAAAPAAAASELKPLQAGTFVLGNQSVSVYYTVSGDIYEVVATIAPDNGGSGAPIRLVGWLQPGQKALVSTGEFGKTAEPATLELEHQGDRLSATEMTQVAVAN